MIKINKKEKKRKKNTKVEKKENTKYWEISCATDSGISMTKRKSDHAQHMVDRKKNTTH
jgi:hypothetical protein